MLTSRRKRTQCIFYCYFLRSKVLFLCGRDITVLKLNARDVFGWPQRTVDFQTLANYYFCQFIFGYGFSLLF